LGNVKFGGQFNLSNPADVPGGFFDGGLLTPSKVVSCAFRIPIPAIFFTIKPMAAQRGRQYDVFPSSDLSRNRSAWYVSRRCVAQLRSAGHVEYRCTWRPCFKCLSRDWVLTSDWRGTQGAVCVSGVLNEHAGVFFFSARGTVNTSEH